MNATVRVSVIALFCLAAAACAQKQAVKPAPPPPEATTTAPVATSGAFTPADLESNACLRTREIYFDFDKSDIKSQFNDIIACHAKYLRDRPMARMTLEGNTDERGTREYNLGLGERRGNAVAAALEADGASADQITVVSYGEERPVCREHNESCWQQNRRVNIVYTTE
jgi:peptidoglycan-associated lipoprotein